MGGEELRDVVEGGGALRSPHLEQDAIGGKKGGELAGHAKRGRRLGPK
jgi:hypothetical protein